MINLQIIKKNKWSKWKHVKTKVPVRLRSVLKVWAHPMRSDAVWGARSSVKLINSIGKLSVVRYNTSAAIPSRFSKSADGSGCSVKISSCGTWPIRLRSTNRWFVRNVTAPDFRLRSTDPWINTLPSDSLSSVARCRMIRWAAVWIIGSARPFVRIRSTARTSVRLRSTADLNWNWS